MNNKMKIFVFFIILAIAGGGFAYYMYNKPHENIKNKKADIEITANELIADFEADEASAKEKYKDKLLQVSGAIEGINRSNDGGLTLLFLNEGASMGNVKAGIQSVSAEKAKNLKAGDEVTVKGRFTGSDKMDEMGISMIDIQLSRCIVIEE